jgi:hypothetical protein
MYNYFLKAQIFPYFKRTNKEFSRLQPVLFADCFLLDITLTGFKTLFRQCSKNVVFL